MKRGENYYANLDPAVTSEQAKPRPVLIVSNDANNRAANTVRGELMQTVDRAIRIHLDLR